MAKTERADLARGELITISTETRKRWTDRRRDKAKTDPQFAQEPFADKIGTSQGTISNVERGTQKQIRKSLFVKWERALFGRGDGGLGDDEFLARFTEAVVKMDPSRVRGLYELSQLPPDIFEAVMKLSPRTSASTPSTPDGEPQLAGEQVAPPSAQDRPRPHRRRRQKT